MQPEYRICTRCIMDTSDPEISFNDEGICSHCIKYDELKNKYLHHQDGGVALKALIEKIKAQGAGKKYDCVIGVSGGVDSTYVAYLVKKLGLRPLAVHLDNGWNSELAVSNIEKTLKILEIDLYTYVIDWEEFKDLQLSFLKASVPDAEIPTDHAIVAIIFKIAAQMGIKYLISGSNFATEAIAVRSWSYGHSDWRYIKSIQKRFGKMKLKSFPHYSISDLFYYKVIKGQRAVKLLDYIDYNKAEAMRILEDELGWKYYGGKHYESIYTRFFQGYILPRKFGFDKRRAHLSTLICSNQLTREEALQEIQNDPYPENMLNDDIQFLIKKFNLTEEEFKAIMELPKKTFWDYPSYENHVLLKYFKRLYKYLSVRFPAIKKVGF